MVSYRYPKGRWSGYTRLTLPFHHHAQIHSSINPLTHPPTHSSIRRSTSSPLFIYPFIQPEVQNTTSSYCTITLDGNAQSMERYNWWIALPDGASWTVQSVNQIRTDFSCNLARTTALGQRDALETSVKSWCRPKQGHWPNAESHDNHDHSQNVQQDFKVQKEAPQNKTTT